MHLAQAYLINEGVATYEIPYINEKTVNRIQVIYLLNGLDSTEQHIDELTGIAMQCPYSGGRAVYRARSILSLLNIDSVYDDAVICSPEGNYRSPLNNKESEKENEIKIIPNPANTAIRLWKMPHRFENCIERVPYPS